MGRCAVGVLFHRYHGVKGLAPQKNVNYSADEKLSFLQHMWEHKLSYLETAARFNIRSQCCLGEWEQSFGEDGIVPLNRKPRGRPKRMSEAPKETSQTEVPSDETRPREELVEELNFLRMENAYLKKLRALVQSDLQAAAARKKRK
jgi:transposase